MSRCWLVVFAFASACGGPQRAPAAGPDRLAAIRITGNRAIASDALEPALALHEALGDGAAVDPYVLTLDTDRIRAAYVKRGFFAVRVTPEVRREAGAQVVVFHVVEGRRAVTRVAITGLPPELPLARARALVALDDGAAFDYDAYDAAKQPLAELLENAGYARAEVRATVDADPAAAVATVRYALVPGARCTFGQIRMPGVRPALAAAARARLRFAEGDRYSAAALAESAAELTQLGRFSSVQVVPDRSGDGSRIDVAVELVEASRHEAHLGVGAGYEPESAEARARGGASVVPAAWPLLTLAADARVAVTIKGSNTDFGDLQPKLRILGSVQRIDLWRPRLRGEIEGGFDYQTLEAYTWTGGHVRLGLASPLGPRWLQARIGWLLERLSYDTDLQLTAGGRALGLAHAQRIGAYQASLIADLRDNPFEPHRGVYAAITGAIGTRYAGGDLDYRQITPELRGYFALGGVVIAVRARAGRIVGDVPVTERYFSGGTSGQRGFSERQLAPRAINAAPGCEDTPRPPGMAVSSGPVIGGAGLFETGVELRSPSPAGIPVGANLFLDGADVRCAASGLDATQLHWAVGAGVWLKLAGLKIRSDIGYRLNRRGDGELPVGTLVFDALRGFAWHLGVGETY